MLRKINLSGHDNQSLAEMGYMYPGTLQVNLGDPELAAKLTTFLSQTIGIGSDDSVVLALPGLSPLAAMVVAICHGLTGNFPVIQLMQRQADGSFVPGATVDLQAVRDGARTQRQNTVVL